MAIAALEATVEAQARLIAELRGGSSADPPAGGNALGTLLSWWQRRCGVRSCALSPTLTLSVNRTMPGSGLVVESTSATELSGQGGRIYYDSVRMPSNNVEKRGGGVAWRSGGC